MTTRFGWMRSMREAQAGVWPTWLQGSRVTYHVLSESSGFAVGDSSVFLDANSLMSLGALGGLSAGDVPAVFFVGAAEVDRGSVTSSEGEGP